MKPPASYRWLAVASPVALLLLWEALNRTGVLDARYVPPPSQVLATLVRLTQSGELPYHLGVSVRRILAGFVLGAAPAVALGLAMGLNRAVRAVLMPVVAAVYPIPRSLSIR
jgi:NitT/TauT family transport system permease protein